MLSACLAGSGLAWAAGGGMAASDPGAMQGRHFDTKGKSPSAHTIEAQQGLRKSLPFEDERDFAEATKGFIAAPDYKQIMAEAGNVAWDMGSYEWLLQGKDFDSIHPSLQRQAILNMAYGLYEVLPDKIYQVRGYDLA
ncbi:MAG: MBL fold metallo-hydrolase, partial [Gammaproteobacteria bacterium]